MIEQRSCFLHGDYTGKDECPMCELSLLQCQDCGRLTTELEARLRVFNEGRCATCNGVLRPAAAVTL